MLAEPNTTTTTKIINQPKTDTPRIRDGSTVVVSVLPPTYQEHHYEKNLESKITPANASKSTPPYQRRGFLGQSPRNGCRGCYRDYRPEQSNCLLAPATHLLVSD